ncbi:MAG: DNA polymerase IV, partial [Novosphingobium sp.]
GPRGAEKLGALGIATGADLAAAELAFLRAHFGSMADYLFRAARGIDLREVRAHRVRKSVSAERTFMRDLSTGSALREALGDIVAAAWERIERSAARGRTVTLKLRLADFRAMTRARSFAEPIATRAAFARAGEALLDAALPLPQPVRLIGLGLSALDGEPDAEVEPRTAPVQDELPLA